MPKEEDPSKRPKIQDMLNDEMRELARIIAKDLSVKSQRIDDPFEHYAYQVKMRWYCDTDAFSDRLVKGYQALLEQLKNI